MLCCSVLKFAENQLRHFDNNTIKQQWNVNKNGLERRTLHFDLKNLHHIFLSATTVVGFCEGQSTHFEHLL